MMDDGVQPKMVWGPAVGKSNAPKMFCGVEECKPWTRSEELPGRSYKTSTGISHKAILPIFEFVETKPLKLAADTVLRDYRYKSIHYKTSYGNAYKNKFNSKGLTDTPNVPHAIGFTLNYQWVDKLRTFPPGKMDLGNSEMKDNYTWHKSTTEGPGRLNDLKPLFVCQMHCPGREALDKTPANINCIQKIMDPYVTTMQGDYVYYDEDARRRYRHKDVKPVQIFEKKPMYDESFLGKKFMDRIVRKKIPLVPHRSMLSEMQENFKLPLDELAHKKVYVCSSLKYKPLTKGEVMSITGMYHTDYEHIGHDWPLSSVV
ncbi:uncharacterized protein [Halyomorpha halys]|uniref:uncharacterized protein n=1 Tax=Halyomorpha halys TaxID=286706 RepID=UPI0006D4EE99|nr:uncharacterized protein LOC106679418 [Halyomorpha halys]